MSDTVSTVGDLCGKHVGTVTVRISLLGSEIVGVVTELNFIASYVKMLSGERCGESVAYIELEGEIELNSVPLSTPASVEPRSDPQ